MRWSRSRGDSKVDDLYGIIFFIKLLSKAASQPIHGRKTLFVRSFQCANVKKTLRLSDFRSKSLYRQDHPIDSSNSFHCVLFFIFTSALIASQPAVLLPFLSSPSSPPPCRSSLACHRSTAGVLACSRSSSSFLLCSPCRRLPHPSFPPPPLPPFPVPAPTPLLFFPPRQRRCLFPGAAAAPPPHPSLPPPLLPPFPVPAPAPAPALPFSSPTAALPLSPRYRCSSLSPLRRRCLLSSLLGTLGDATFSSEPRHHQICCPQPPPPPDPPSSMRTAAGFVIPGHRCHQIRCPRAASRHLRVSPHAAEVPGAPPSSHSPPDSCGRGVGRRPGGGAGLLDGADATGGGGVAGQEHGAQPHRGWGVAMLVGVPHKADQFKTHPMNFLSEKTLKRTFFGNYKPRTDLPNVVEMYMKKEIELEKFITHSVPFSEINTAFDLMLKGESLRCIMRMED